MDSHRISTVVIEVGTASPVVLADRVSAAVNDACAAIEADGGSVLHPIAYTTMVMRTKAMHDSCRTCLETEYENVIVAKICFKKQR